MTVKSIFVPESYLREEIRVGYDQAGGDADPAEDEAAAEGKSLVEFKPAETEAADETEPIADDEPVTDDAADAGPSAFLADDDPDGDLEADQGPDADLYPETTDIYDDLKKFDALDNLGEEPQPVATGGGLFGNDFTSVLQTLMVSGNNMPVADILEDGVYELNAIKSYLDSIAQSLAKIAEKYAGDGYGNNKRDRNDRNDRNDRGNKPYNNDRGNKGNKQFFNDRGQQGQDRQDRQDDAEPEAQIEDGLDE